MNKKKFLDYERVRQSGKYNMILEARFAAAEAGLSNDEYLDIVINYSKYRKTYI